MAVLVVEITVGGVSEGGRRYYGAACAVVGRRMKLVGRHSSLIFFTPVGSEMGRE